MSLRGSMLDQLVVTGTPQVIAATGGASEELLVTSVLLANTSGEKQSVRLYYSRVGGAVTSANAIAWDVPVRPKSFLDLQLAISLDGATNELSISGTGGVTATSFGMARSVS